MRVILLLISVSFIQILYAQDTTVVITMDSSSIYYIQMLDNTTLSGKIIERNNNEIIFNDVTVGKVTIPVNKIKKFTKISGNQYCILTTNDGKKFSGIIISQTENQISIKTESLGELTILNSKIREITLVEKEQFKNGKYFFQNPHPTRYFFGPSAIPLEKGEGYFQNAYILANSVQVGVTDHFSIGGGIVIPIFFFVTPKIGFKVGKNVYLGGGVLAATAFTSDISIGLGVAYGSLTLGNKENNFTINLGWGFMRNEVYNSQTSNSDYKWEFSKKPMMTFSGALRVAPMCSLITENWVFATKDYNYDSNISQDTYTYKYHKVLSFGFRIMNQRNAFDIALALPTIDNQTIGLPYFDYTFKF